MSLPLPQVATAAQVRAAARASAILSTSGLAPGYIQANLIVLPSRFAQDFRTLCARNPVPCPLLAESAYVGSYSALKSWISGITDEQLAGDLDIRTDAPRYNVYEGGTLVQSHVGDIKSTWTPDHVAFLVGCSYSFEAALTAAALPPRHTVLDRVVPMYRSSLPLLPAGVFGGNKATFVVSMRPYPRSQIRTVRDVTRPYITTHGEPIAWGWDAVKALGIEDVNVPDWGEAPATTDGAPLVSGDEENVPVFWGCGVTPQEAVMRAQLPGIVMGHAPGHMIVLDVKDSDVLPAIASNVK